MVSSLINIQTNYDILLNWYLKNNNNKETKLGLTTTLDKNLEDKTEKITTTPNIGSLFER